MNTAKKYDPVSFGHYLVAFIDVLGQRDILRTLNYLPSNQEEYDKFVRTIKNSFGAIDGIRKWHENFFEAMNQPPSYWNNLSEDQRTQFRSYKRSVLKTIWFSDTALMYTPIQSSDEHIPINSLYGTLVWGGSVMLMSLAASRPVRGGIDIGVGAEMYDGEIYGQCVVSAYDLESNIAQYPRIVVGQNTIEYLRSRLNSNEGSKMVQYEKRLAETCLSLITVDSDGNHIIDYAGSTFRSLTEAHPTEPELLPKALLFVQNQITYFERIGEHKLLQRYKRLLNYLTHRGCS